MSIRKLTMVVALGLFSYLSINMNAGPALNGESATGSNFDGQTCAACHSGGSYGTGVTIQLLKNGSPVTTYNYNGTYTLRITRTNTTTPPYWGFQVTCAASTSPYASNNTWGTTLPTNTAKRTVNSWKYIEHTTKLSGGISQIDLPWIGPPSGTTTLKFNVAIIAANGNSGSSGDQVASSSLTVTASGLPVTFLYFNGNKVGDNVELEWGVSHEQNCKEYVMESSDDGSNFTTIATITSKNQETGNTVYNLTDKNVRNTKFYRVKEIDFDGNEHYFRTIEVKSQEHNFNTVYTYNNEIVLNYFSDAESFVSANLISLDGRNIGLIPIYLNNGMNRMSFSKPEIPGLYLVVLKKNSKVIFNEKVWVQ